MTDALRREGRARRAGRARRDFVLRESRDPRALAAILGRDRLHAAYALAQLDPEAFVHARYWLCEGPATSAPDGSGRVSLVCHSRAGLGDTTYVMGPAEGVAHILSLHPGAYQTFITARPAHIEALESAYRLRNPRTMRRMHVTRDRFRAAPRTAPGAAPGAAPGPAFRLRPTHVRALNRLYSSEGAPATYGARHLREGCYYGIQHEGELLAVAGTHSLSARAGIAVLGNVFTHPAARGRGLATITTSAVTAVLLAGQPDVVLSVEPDNLPAVRAYRRLGYRDAGTIVEAQGQRRVGSVTTALRRRLAAYRGRHAGVEIVRG